MKIQQLRFGYLEGFIFYANQKNVNCSTADSDKLGQIELKDDFVQVALDPDPI